MHSKIEKITQKQLEEDNELLEFRKKRINDSLIPTEAPSPSQKLLTKRKLIDFKETMNFHNQFKVFSQSFKIINIYEKRFINK